MAINIDSAKLRAGDLMQRVSKKGQGVFSARHLVPAICVATALFVSLPVCAETDTIDGVTWNYTTGGGKATVTGIERKQGELKIPAELGGFPVEAIGECAFFEDVGLTEVTIPNSVKAIGERAFWNCAGLRNVSIGRGLTTIGRRAFAECYGLKSVDVADENEAFASADGVLYSKDGKTLVLRPSAKEGGSFVIPDGVEVVGEMALAHCHALTNLVLPASVASIGTRAFAQCYRLTELALPDGVAVIGGEAFERCYGLTNFVIPTGVKVIEPGTFDNCHFTDLTIPDSVESIGGWAFCGCTKLTNLVIGAGVTDIGPSAFQSCRALRTLSIPDTVTNVGKLAFVECTSLVALEVPDAWHGTDVLVDAWVPEGCTVTYRGAGPAEKRQEDEQ